MKCPNCNKAGCRYEQRNPRKRSGNEKINFIRTNFKAKCKFCGWEGEAWESTNIAIAMDYVPIGEIMDSIQRIELSVGQRDVLI